ncbi:MAG: hypothetical protein ABJG68_10325 [Crocinitomicaceae bacterium]
MKKLSLILLFAMGFFMISCGGEEAEVTEGDNTEEVADHECCSDECADDCEIHAEEKKNCDKDCCGGEKKCDKSCDKDKKCDKDSTAEGACEEGACMEGACAGGEAHDKVEEVIEEVTE